MSYRLGPVLKRIRKNRDLTQRELAQLAGVHPVTIAKIEAGMKEPSLKLTRKLAEALSVSVRSLVG